jgi:hypothetical protein
VGSTRPPRFAKRVKQDDWWSSEGPVVLATAEKVPAEPSCERVSIVTRPVQLACLSSLSPPVENEFWSLFNSGEQALLRTARPRLVELRNCW